MYNLVKNGFRKVIDMIKKVFLIAIKYSLKVKKNYLIYRQRGKIFGFPMLKLS